MVWREWQDRLLSLKKKKKNLGTTKVRISFEVQQ